MVITKKIPRENAQKKMRKVCHNKKINEIQRKTAKEKDK